MHSRLWPLRSSWVLRRARRAASRRHGRRRRVCIHRVCRRGASTVEFAIVAPLVFFVILALIQFAGLLMSQNVLTAAAREGGRTASMPSTLSSETVVSAVQERLTRAGIDPSLVDVDVEPTALAALEAGDDVRVTVSAPLSSMGWIWAIAPPDANMSADVTYDRE